jgi:2-polyprenyl-6-methoxyphenol hydroxylase-like FAD-dependent oxidoreductase
MGPFGQRGTDGFRSSLGLLRRSTRREEVTSIVITGGGVVGLCTAMLMADDGHEVTVLERDPAPAPRSEDAWDSWERRGINQFRLGHFFMPRFRQEMERELPRVVAALEEAGGVRFHPFALAPTELTGGWREEDERFWALTGRRPVFESVIAACADDTAGVTVQRGETVLGLTTGPEGSDGVPHVTGVRTSSGREVAADLVVDMTGRRSPLPQWLAAVGAPAPLEELEDSGFFYYGRHFRSADGTVPPNLGPLAQDCGSVTILTLPCDNGTWGVVIVASAKDKELRFLRDVERWTAAMRGFPLVAHWVEGEPLEDHIFTMTKIEDRRRCFVVDGRPVATGVVAVADAWACTNPSLGRGVSIGLLHALSLRDTLRGADLSEPRAFASAFDAATIEQVEPWYRATLSYDRHRLAEIEAELADTRYEPDDQEWEITRSLQHAAGSDPDCLRASLEIVSVLETPDEVLSRPGLMEKVVSVGSGWRDEPLLGLSRKELVAVASG